MILSYSIHDKYWSAASIDSRSNEVHRIHPFGGHPLYASRNRIFVSVIVQIDRVSFVSAIVPIVLRSYRLCQHDFSGRIDDQFIGTISARLHQRLSIGNPRAILRVIQDFESFIGHDNARDRYRIIESHAMGIRRKGEDP